MLLFAIFGRNSNLSFIANFVLQFHLNECLCVSLTEIMLEFRCCKTKQQLNIMFILIFSVLSIKKLILFFYFSYLFHKSKKPERQNMNYKYAFLCPHWKSPFLIEINYAFHLINGQSYWRKLWTCFGTNLLLIWNIWNLRIKNWAFKFCYIY